MSNLNLKIEKNELILKDLIISLSNSFGNKLKNYLLSEDENKIRPFIIVLINEISIDLLDNLNTILKNNDTISFLTSIHGGSL